MADYVLFTSYTDTDGLWSNEMRGSDGLTVNPYYAGHVTHPQNTWTGFLEFHRSATWCDAIRIWKGTWLVGSVMIMDLDIYYNGTWHHVYQGAASVDSGGLFIGWSLGGFYWVTAARVRCYNSSTGSYPTLIWEIQIRDNTPPATPAPKSLIFPKWNWNNNW